MKKKIFIILIAVLAAILAYGIYYLKTPVNSQKAERITEVVSVDSNAVFVRDEDVYSAPVSGYVYYSYNDGERVQKSVCVANVYEGQPTEEQLKSLSVIDRKLKASLYSGTNTIEIGTTPEAAENNINEYRKNIITASKNHDLYTTGTGKAMINAVRAGESKVESIDTEESLEAKKAETEKQIGFAKTDIYSEHSGVFTTILDGLEKTLTPSKAESITLEQINSIHNIQSKSTERTLKKGDVMFKIVNNHEWYVLIVVNSDDVSDYKSGKTVKLSFENIPGEVAEGRIEKITPVEDGKSIVFVHCQKYLEGAYSFRESKVNLEFDRYEGYKVPLSAIHVDGNEKSVTAIRGNKTDNYPVKVVFSNTKDGYAIIDSEKDAALRLDDVDYIVVGER